MPDYPSRPGSVRVPHPRSPAARMFEWSSLSFLHPEAPQARSVDWGSEGLPHPDSPSGRVSLWDAGRTEIDRSAEDELTQIRLDAERSLDKHSDSLRDALPDTGLQILYDRQTGLLRESYSFMGSFTVTDPGQLLRKSQRQIAWVHCHLQEALTAGYRMAVEPILNQLDGLQTQAFGEERANLLRTVQVLSERYYTTATSGIQERLAEVRTSGKQQEWIHTWRARMLACASSGAAATTEAPPEAPAPARRPPRKTDSSEAAVKTWIAFQLVDEDGLAVPHIPYKVTLSDKSVMQGLLDDQGTVRFEDIDPGACTVCFPEIHAMEWKPA